MTWAPWPRASNYYTHPASQQQRPLPRRAICVPSELPASLCAQRHVGHDLLAVNDGLLDLDAMFELGSLREQQPEQRAVVGRNRDLRAAADIDVERRAMTTR